MSTDGGFRNQYDFIPSGIMPDVASFGAITQPARKTPSVTQMELAFMIYKSMDEVFKIHTMMTVEFGLKHVSGPK